MNLYSSAHFRAVGSNPVSKRPIRRWLLLVALSLTSCTVTVETRPDGSKIETKQADRAVLRFGADVVRAYSPREIERRSK